MKILLQCPCCGPGGWMIWLLTAAGLWMLFQWMRTMKNSKGDSMNKTARILIVIGLAAAVLLVFAARHSKTDKTASASAHSLPQPTGSSPLPRLVDLGAGKCIPCKMMAPILESLKKEYAGKFDVIFIDVWEKPDEGAQYGIRMIPTQIFFDPSGKELFRHEGFFSKEDILAKWKELGFDFSAPAGESAPQTETLSP
ncbi:MAG: thioredoxin family protein [Anaerohalosphaeraceae bacterium]